MWAADEAPYEDSCPGVQGLVVYSNDAADLNKTANLAPENRRNFKY